MDCDHGGAIRDYLARYLASGPVAIRSCCESACTLALGWPETCVTANARLGFHAASNANGTFLMYSMMPATVRAWIDRHGGLAPRMIYLSGREAIRIGVRACA